MVQSRNRILNSLPQNVFVTMESHFKHAEPGVQAVT